MPAAKTTLTLQNRLATFFYGGRTIPCRRLLTRKIWAGRYLKRLQFFVNKAGERKATDFDQAAVCCWLLQNTSSVESNDCSWECQDRFYRIVDRGGILTGWKTGIFVTGSYVSTSQSWLGTRKTPTGFSSARSIA
jgi:hypothetical protein